MMNHQRHTPRNIFARGGLLIIAVAFGVFTFSFLLTGYGATFLNLLPFLLLLACPLMHFLMHGRHAHEAPTSGKSY